MGPVCPGALPGEGMKKSAQPQMESGQGAAFPPLAPTSRGPLPFGTQEEGAGRPAKSLTAYWNFSLYSRSLARALLSSSATER